jgi:hypothetical protein
MESRKSLGFVQEAQIAPESSEWAVNYKSSFVVQVGRKLTVTDFFGVLEAHRAYNTDWRTDERVLEDPPVVYALNGLSVLVEMHILVEKSEMPDEFVLTCYESFKRDKALYGCFDVVKGFSFEILDNEAKDIRCEACGDWFTKSEWSKHVTRFANSTLPAVKSELPLADVDVTEKSELPETPWNGPNRD